MKRPDILETRSRNTLHLLRRQLIRNAFGGDTSMLGLFLAKKRSCPHCRRSYVEREPRKGLWLRTVCGLTGMRPYRCLSCDALFLAPKRQGTAAVHAKAH